MIGVFRQPSVNAGFLSTSYDHMYSLRSFTSNNALLLLTTVVLKIVKNLHELTSSAVVVSGVAAYPLSLEDARS